MDNELLTAKLADFGLNPTDWILETGRRIGHVFQVKVHSPEGLSLEGWVDGETWLDLSYQG